MNRSTQPLHSSWRTKEGDLRLVVVAQVLAAVVVPVANAGRGPRAESAAVVAHPLPKRLQGLEPRGFLGRVKAHAFRRAVIDRHEHGEAARTSRIFPVNVSSLHSVFGPRRRSTRWGCAAMRS